ncbi:MAG TPA: hypothetical protein P5531_00430 [Bacteroidales bacterium]|nr:hypothetical protein [Bacteroidales bacterium]HSA42125.1 hypothetical protein [Bacteroidales bacterium]
MKKIIFLSFILACALNLQAQDQESGKKSASRFSTGLIIYHDLWMGDAANMNPRFLNQGAAPFVMYNIPVEKSALVFSVGMGIGTHNLYSDAFLQLDSAGNYSFVNIDTYKDPEGNALSYKKNKFSVAYWDFPFQFRYESRSGFKGGLGMTFGFQLNSLTKYKGDDPAGSGNNVKIKTKYIKNLEKWRYGFTASLGYKWIELYGYYQLINVFKQDKGPEIYPVSVGISLRPMFLN